MARRGSTWLGELLQRAKMRWWVEDLHGGMHVKQYPLSDPVLLQAGWRALTRIIRHIGCSGLIRKDQVTSM